MTARDDYPKLHAETSGAHHQGGTSAEAQIALDEIDRLRAQIDEANSEWADAIAQRDTARFTLAKLAGLINAERQRGHDRKQKAAASHALGNYDRLLGYEAALEWCADLLREVGQ